MTVAELIPSGAAVAGLAATTPADAVRELMDALVACGGVAADLADALVAQAVERERAATTGFGNGVALPHAKSPIVAKPVAAVGTSAAGIDFAALDKRPVFVVALLLSPAQPEAHLAAMNAIWPRLADAAVRRSLRAATTAGEVEAILRS